jgi:hypothetical protein
MTNFKTLEGLFTRKEVSQNLKLTGYCYSVLKTELLYIKKQYCIEKTKIKK